LPDRDRPDTVRRTALLAAAAVTMGLLVGLCLMEGVIRIYAATNHSFGTGIRQFDPMAVQIEPHGRLGYRQRPNATFHYANGSVATSNSLRYRGPEVAPHPDSGVVRIILLGGSTTHGFGVADDQTIDTYMRAIFREKYPARRFEVVNLAFDGYDAYQMLERLRSDGLRLHPTVVVLNEGINDVRNAQFSNLRDADPRTLIWESVLARLRAEQERGGPTLWTRLKHYSFVARTPGYIRDQLARRHQEEVRREQASRAAASMDAGDGNAGASVGALYWDAANFFERYMRQMVALSIDGGAAVLLSTPPSALRTYAPTATSTRTYWIINARTTQIYRDTLAARLRSIASTEQSLGRRVLYVAPTVPPPLYLDDCHLKPEGNRMVAAMFVDAIDSLLASAPRGDSKQKVAARH